MGAQPAGSVADMMVFAQVFEAGSLTRAARRLGSTRSAVSKSVARLERHLGTKLLHRTTRELSPTPAGQACYVHCAEIVAAVTRAERIAGELRATPKGRLRVTCASSVGALLAPAFPRFLARHGEVTLEIEVSDRPIDLVREGVDVGIRIGFLPDSSVAGRKLASYRRMVCASPAYLARHGVPQAPRDLTGHNCLVRTGHGQWRFRSSGRSRSVPVSGNYRADSPELLRQAAVAGLGVTSLPSFVIHEDVARKRLRPILEAYELGHAAIYAVYSQHRHLSPNVRAFVDFLVESAEGLLEPQAGRSRPMPVSKVAAAMRKAPK